jgi:arylsulfatase A-like enzyme
VPLVVYDPRKSESHGARTRALTGSIDLAPMILELAGVKVPSDIDGVSLLPLLADPDQSVRKSLTLMNVWGPESVYSLSIMSGAWKYIYWPSTAKGMKPAEEVYNIADDPLELTNLVDDPVVAEQLASLREQYDFAVSHWSTQAVEYHNYKTLAEYFTRKETSNE